MPCIWSTIDWPRVLFSCAGVISCCAVPSWLFSFWIPSAVTTTPVSCVALGLEREVLRDRRAGQRHRHVLRGVADAPGGELHGLSRGAGGRNRERIASLRVGVGTGAERGNADAHARKRSRRVARDAAADGGALLREGSRRECSQQCARGRDEAAEVSRHDVFYLE